MTLKSISTWPIMLWARTYLVLRNVQMRQKHGIRSRLLFILWLQPGLLLNYKMHKLLTRFELKKSMKFIFKISTIGGSYDNNKYIYLVNLHLLPTYAPTYLLVRTRQSKPNKQHACMHACISDISSNVLRLVRNCY